VLWIQNAEADRPIEADPSKAAEMARLPAIKALPCVKNQRIYVTNSGSKWLPGSGLLKIRQELASVYSALDH